MSIRPRPLAFPLFLLLALAFAGASIPARAAQTPGITTSPPSGTEKAADESPQWGALADTLENDAKRQRLIEDLRRMAADSEPDAGKTTAAQPPLPQRIADASQAMAARLIEGFGQSVEAIRGLGAGPAVDWAAVSRIAGDLVLLILATVAAYAVLRRVARPLYGRAGAWAVGAPDSAVLLRRAGALLFTAAIDAVTIALAWLVGWAVTVALSGGGGPVDTRLVLFLNAFLGIETFKLLVRIVFAARDDRLRLLPMGGEEAAYWNAWLAHLASFVGYGALVAVPLVRSTISPALAQLLYVLVVALGFVYALSIVLQNRARVRGRFIDWSTTAALGSTRVAAAILARVWHLALIAYLVALTVVLLLRPEEVLPYMGKATLQSLVAIGLGVLIGALIGRAISRGIRIPEATRARFPLLEPRLNAFVPRGLQAIRAVILLLVVALVLDAWAVFDLGAWIVSDAGVAVLSTVASVLAIIFGSAVAWIVIASWVDYWLNPETGTGIPSARHRTLLALFRNAVAVVIVTLATMITLSELGLDIGPLLAGAGVLGLAIGFGAQKLVQDIIGGVFIQLENAINTGDWVTAGGISGTAERLSIRSVGLRDLEGTFHIVPFSSVDTVSNYMRDFAYHVGVYGVAYREDTDEVITHLIAAFGDLQKDEELAPEILGDLEIAGVTAFADSAVNIRVRIMTTPGFQWRVGRAYNRLVKRHFDAAGIEIPFPHTTLYFGQDRDGSAPAAHVRLDSQPESDAT